MESLYKLVEKRISYLYTILLNKLCATDTMLLMTSSCVFSEISFPAIYVA